MVFGRGYRRTGRKAKPAQLTTNHCIFPQFTSVGGTTNQQAIFTTVEPPTNRGQHIPAAAMLKGVDIQLWSVGPPPEGVQRCLMVYQPGATTYTDPIDAWLSTSDPMTEEAIQIRQNVMQRLHQWVYNGAAVLPPYFRCRWKGNISLRDGDDIIVAIRSDEDTVWEGLCTAWWIA